MKKFPRIYSLSTLNLIYHHDFDYVFHPLRTDFIGDSGSGKSMIADMLQLAFVGSGVFESATTGTDKRPPSTMVLRTAGRGSDFGYVFLNIEIEEKQYVSIGCFIQSNSNTTQSFIVQAGHNYSDSATLESFSKPLTTADFVKGDYILPIEEFKEYVNKKDLTCHSWQRLKTFHSILYANKILPIDLTKSDKTLSDYAKILQSFSRKILDTGDSHSLQEFLFGQEQFTEIKKAYKAAVQELGSSVSEYASNLKDIESITAKQTAIAELKKLKDIRDATRNSFFENNFQYLNYLKRSNELQLKKLVNNHLQSGAKLNALKEILNEKKKVLKKNIISQDIEVQKAMDTLEEFHEPNSSAEKITKWLLKFNCKEGELNNKFKDYHILLKLKKDLASLNDLLHSKNLWQEFKNYQWNKSYPLGRKQIEVEIKSISDKINEKEILKKFSNLNNKDSLAYWAFNLDRSLTQNEESVILKFVTIGTTKPNNINERFIPEPGKLFKDLIFSDETIDGFWIDLGGVLEYVTKVKHQLLATNDKQKIKGYFQQFNESLDTEITKLKQDLNRQELLETSLDHLESPGKSIEAWLRESELKNFEEDKSLHISEETFDSYMSHWKNRIEISKKYKAAQTNYENLKTQCTENKSTLENIDEEIEKLNRIDVSFRHFGTIKSEFPEMLQEPVHNEIISSLTSNLDNVGRYLSSVRSIITTEERNIRNEQIKIALDQLQDTKQKEKSFIKEAGHLNIQLPQLKEREWAEPLDEKSKADTAHATYYIKYSTTFTLYLPHDAYKFREVDDFLGLTQHLLPEAFLEVQITEEGVIDQIEQYLKRILTKNHQLNQRKLQKVDNLLDEVSSAVSQQLDTIRKIKNFLNDDEKTITGGHQAYLEEYFEPNFKSDWITKFRIALKEDQGLFAQPNGIHEQLSQYISLDEKMIQAFYSSGGSSIVQPTLDKLLNPFSYYGLKFGMRGIDGTKNAGSTGQTYAAIALLCIARLSLINLEDANNSNPGVRFMAIDEAEGLGSNYDMLYQIAKKNDYQIISLSINPIDKFRENEQYMYMIHKNPDVEEKINLTPMGIFSEEGYKKSGL